MMAGEAAKRSQSCARDFLLRFGSSACPDNRAAAAAAGGEESGEIELGLGLSLGGCLGAEPKGKKLVRSSSVASLPPFPSDGDPPAAAAGADASLMRTSSLPVETEEEQRKRKELQSLRRMEAKRKRLERRSSIKSAAGEQDVDSKVGGRLELGINSCVVPSPAPATQLGERVNGAMPSEHHGRPAGLVRGGSLPELNLRPAQAAGGHADSDKAMAAPSNPTDRAIQNPWRKNSKAGRAHSVGEVERNMMEEMPCVSTKGEGPGGRRVEGFLYKYRKGEEVRIVCVCHGSFLTPAEFVRHAGGGEVMNPLRHIVVNPVPPPFP